MGDMKKEDRVLLKISRISTEVRLLEERVKTLERISELQIIRQ